MLTCETKTQVTEAAAATRCVKILIVDDSADNLALFHAILEELDCPMVCARSGAEALEHLAGEEFAVVLLDVNMPGMDGFEVARQLRAGERNRHTPVLFIPGDDGASESVMRSYAAGGVDFLMKPVKVAVLRAKVRVFVELAAARQQLTAEVAERRRTEAELAQLNAELERRVAARTAELHESEERFRLAMKATHDVVWDWDVVNDVERWNDAGGAFLDASAGGEIPNVTAWWTEHLHPDERQRAVDSFQAVLDDPKRFKWEDEYRFRRLDGSYALLFEHAYVMRNEEGRPVRMIGTLVDITERRRAEEALRENEERLRLALDAAGMGTWRRDGAQDIMSCDATAQAHFGIGPVSSLAENLTRVHPDDRERVRSAIERAWTTDGLYAEEYRVKNGGEDWRWLRVEARVQFTGAEDGRLGLRAIGTTQDITARKKAEERLHAAEDSERATFWRMLRSQAALIRLRDHDAVNLGGKIRLATEECAAVLGVSRASVWMFDAGRENLECRDLFVAGKKLHENGTRLPAAQFPDYFAAVQKQQAVVAQDAHTHPATREFSTGYLAALGITSMIAVPIRFGGAVTGVLCCEHTGEVRHWLREEEDFALAVASFVLLAIETEERLKAEIGLNEERSLYGDLADAHPVGAYRIRINRQRSHEPDAWLSAEQPPYTFEMVNDRFCEILGVTRAELEARPGLLVELIHPDDLVSFLHQTGGGSTFLAPFVWEGRIVARGGKMRWISLVSQPRVLRSGEIVRTGMLLDITDRKRSETILRMTNEELERRVAQRTEELALMNKHVQAEMEARENLQLQLQNSSEREQERIGQDLHDGLCQTLTGAKFRTELLGKKLRAAMPVGHDEVAAIEELLMDAVKQARGVAYGLNPLKAEDLGLMEALERLAATVHTESGPACACHIPEPVWFSDHALATHVYRIAQEAVQNAFKHGQPKTISIELTKQGDTATLSVTDDGVGVKEAGDSKNGMGFSNMRKRVSLIGGLLQIKPAEGGGTQVICRFRHTHTDRRARHEQE